MSGLSAEQYFVRWGFTCAEQLCYNRSLEHNITEEEFKRIRAAALGKGDISRELIEENFPAAMRRLKRTAKRLGIDDFLEKRVVREYFLVDHQEVIDSGDGSYANFPKGSTFRELCKVKSLKVVAKSLGDTPLGRIPMLQVEERGLILAPYFSYDDVDVGDRVYAHHHFAVEKVE